MHENEVYEMFKNIYVQITFRKKIRNRNKTRAV